MEKKAFSATECEEHSREEVEDSLKERLRGSLPKSVPLDFGLEKTFAL